MKSINTLFLICVMSLGLFSCTSQPKKEHSGLFAVRLENVYGYINRAGKLVINPQFQRVRLFSEGLAAVSIGEKCGYVYKTGKFVVNPQYDLGGDFSEGLAFVKVGDKVGFIDKEGKMVIQPQFDFPSDAPYVLDWAYTFSEGLSAVRVSGKYGFIDKTGNYVINPQFYAVGKFSEGLSSASIGTDSSAKSGYIDKTGKFTINPQYSLAGNFSEGYALVSTDTKREYIDKNGQPLRINHQSYKPDGVFSEGLAKVTTVSNNSLSYSFISESGSIAIDRSFPGAKDFSEGLAAVEIDGKWGYIDKTGEMVIQPQFIDAGLFSGELAFVSLRNASSGILTQGFIDESGNFVWKSEYK